MNVSIYHQNLMEANLSTHKSDCKGWTGYCQECDWIGKEGLEHGRKTLHKVNMQCECWERLQSV